MIKETTRHRGAMDESCKGFLDSFHLTKLSPFEGETRIRVTWHGSGSHEKPNYSVEIAIRDSTLYISKRSLWKNELLTQDASSTSAQLTEKQLSFIKQLSLEDEFWRPLKRMEYLLP